ncbi:tRNA pseudouridine(55) synthase TruB [Listeria costaricensis]|uniref:tRNA pseudouridine(55) synthase TruB n=1 Tax=Listeria costaricensis TaxID=2026604 RepID=UPI000C06A533|nr:tRNA pseudouridine(55) synthase TruB [Listeria costaricensis]
MDGIIPLWKETGMTSHDAVFKLRKILHTKKVGHTGTLDPEVAGVLPICVGRATKLAEYITDEGKTYEAEVVIGTSTTTEDATGEIVAERFIEQDISPESLAQVLTDLTGTITQIPPMYSAVKVNGRKLYEYARKGETVERPKRQVQIKELVRIDDHAPLTANAPSFKIRIKCGKGTYIRTLAVMIGEALGYPAHMKHLVRTQSGLFEAENCLTLAEIEEKMLAGDQSFLEPLEKGAASFVQVVLNADLADQVLNGRVLSEEQLGNLAEPQVALFHQEKLLAIYQRHPNKPGLYKPEKVIMLKNG